ncbi:MAG: tetratricopeptide repeat protein, partial [Candidatus Paceibacterota bacterium]
LSLENPTTEERQLFQDSVANAVNAAQLAVEDDPSESLNWRVLGQIYSTLTLAGVEGAYDRAVEAYSRAHTLDPQNPAIALLQAQLESRSDNMEQARMYAEKSVSLKRNFTEALLFLSQIDIIENNVSAAIERTEAVISLEPNNPARYYQLGVLESSNENPERAMAAFEYAVSLDNDYANARYFLALGYAEQDRTDAALEQLRVIQELNPDNEEIKLMITRLENGEPLAGTETEATALDASGTTFENEQSEAPIAAETDLISIEEETVDSDTTIQTE